MTAETATKVRASRHALPNPALTAVRMRDRVIRSPGPSPAAGSLADLLLRAAQKNASSGLRLFDALRDEDEGEFCSYPDLLDEAQRILGGLQACEHSPGRHVVLIVERARDLVSAFWACMLGGYVACPLVYSQGDLSWATHVARLDVLLDRPLFVAPSRLCQGLRSVNVADLDRLRARKVQEAICVGRHDDPAIIALTHSGDERLKAVVLTHANILAALAGKAERLILTAGDIVFNWMPLDHVTALLEAHMLPLYVGAVQLHVRREAMLAQPVRFLRLVHRYRVSVAYAPDFVLGQIQAALQAVRPGPTRRQILKCDLFSLRHLISNADPSVNEGSRLFLDFLQQFGLVRTAVWRSLTLHETCGGSIYSCEFPGRGRGMESAGAGVPISGLQMRVVDTSGALVAPGESGELQLRGPMVFSQYYNDEGATAMSFAADGWFRSGMLARVEEGCLNLLGRSEDRIAVEGGQYFPQELEAALERLDGIERSFVAVFPVRPKGSDTEQLVVVFASSLSKRDESRLHQLAIAVRNTVTLLWGVRSPWIIPLPKDEFPKTIVGNIERATLQKRFEDGELAAYEVRTGNPVLRLGEHRPLTDPIEAKIAAIYAELLGVDPASLNASSGFFDVGSTSLDILRFQRKLEQGFGIDEIQLGTIMHSPTVRDLASRIRSGYAGIRSEYDPVVSLQLRGRKTPLFCVHPDDGEVLVFVNLAKYFTNERPFYALRARGWGEGEKGFSTLNEMVRTYANAIRTKQPQGPYAIAGYSYGGIVAFELTKLLEAEGERVAFVGVFNQPPYIKQKATRLTAGEEVTRSLQVIGHSYAPSGTVASMVVFYADPLSGTKEEWLSEVLAQWDGFTRLRNRYIEVPGDHHTLMGPKHAFSFQSVLRAELDRALGGR